MVKCARLAKWRFWHSLIGCNDSSNGYLMLLKTESLDIEILEL